MSEISLDDNNININEEISVDKENIEYTPFITYD